MSNEDPVSERVREYAEWVRALRTAQPVPPLTPPEDGPLAHLGRELQMLTTTMAQREAELERLFEVVSAATHGVTLDDVLTRVFAGFKGLIPYDRIGCALLWDDGNTARAAWSQSELGDVQIGAGYSQPLAGSSLEQILETGQPRIINDLPAYLAAKPSSESTRRIVAEGGRSSLTCPLMVEGVPLGFLFFTSRQVGTYQPDHQLIFRQIASQVSALIHKGRVYEELLQHNHRLLGETRRLEVAATIDPLTGVLNRRAFDGLLRRAEAHGEPYGLIACDIDHFKAVNDTWGHEAGDITLKTVAHRLSEGVAFGQNAISRVGGEEFLALIQEVASLDHLGAIAESLRKAVAHAPVVGDRRISVTASFGAAIARPREAAAQVARRADEALYRAKNEGRNRVCLAR